MEHKLDLLKNHHEALRLAEFAVLLHDLGKCAENFIIKFSKDTPTEINQGYFPQFVSGGFNRILQELGPTLSQDKDWKKYVRHATAEMTKNFIPAEFKTGILSSSIVLPVPFNDRDDVTDSNFSKEPYRFNFFVDFHMRFLNPGFLKLIFHENYRLLAVCHQSHHLASGEEKDKLEKDDTEDQTKDKVWMASAFGYDYKLLSALLHQLETGRLEILETLNQLEKTPKLDHDLYRSTLKLIEKVFKNGLGDTQLPINDVTLWDLSHSTASFFKSAVAHYITSGLKKEALKPNFHQDIKWHYLTISVDFHQFVTNTQKLIDIIHRKKYLDDAYDDIKNLLEVEYPIANEIYRDENGVVFLVPESDILQWTAQENDNSITLKQKIMDCFLQDRDSGLLDVIPEIPAHDQLVEAGKTVGTLQDALSARKPAISTSPADVAQVWSYPNVQTAHPEICPVCRLRPVGFDDVGKPDPVAKDRKICSICLKRRSGRAKAWYKSESKFTIWIEEAADINGRAALLGGHFNLKHWLDGSLIEKTLLKNPSFARIRRCWETTHQFWQEILDQFKQNIFSKPCYRVRFKIFNPPNELNDFQAYELKIHDTRINVVWIKAENTFLSADNMVVVARQFGENLKHVKDAKIPLEFLNKLSRANEHQAEEVLALFIQVFTEYQYHPVIEIRESSHYDHPPEKELPPIEAYEVMPDTDEYYPFIPILATPDRFYCIVPAVHALTIARIINCKYQEEMAKVRDRLSLDLGIVYFPKYVPASAVLDAGRRLLEYPDEDQIWEIVPDAGHPQFWTKGNWELANAQNASHLKFKIERTDAGKKTRQLEVQIAIKSKNRNEHGEFKNDNFHPAFLIPVINEQNKTDFGRKLAVEAGAEKIFFAESRFDYIFLDSASRRFETSYDSQIERRFHPVTSLSRSPRPYQIEDLEKLNQIWENLKINLNSVKMTKNKLYGIKELLQQKMLEWHVFDDPSDPAALQAFENLAKNLIHKELHFPENSAQFEMIKDAILDGSFFDCLDIYLHILKSDLK